MKTIFQQAKFSVLAHRSRRKPALRHAQDERGTECADDTVRAQTYGCRSVHKAEKLALKKPLFYN